MMYKNLQGFIPLLEKKAQLIRISAVVVPCLEITEITDRINRKGGSVLLVENVKGADYPVLFNAFDSCTRMSLPLAVCAFLSESEGRPAAMNVVWIFTIFCGLLFLAIGGGFYNG